MAKRSLRASELQEQAAVVQWWESFSRSKGIDPRLLIAIPNGAMLGGDAKLRAIQMHRLKASGLRPGCPDLFLALPCGHIGGLWIEMKAVGKTATREQREFLSVLNGCYATEVCHGVDAAIRAISYHVNCRVPRAR